MSKRLRPNEEPETIAEDKRGEMTRQAKPKATIRHIFRAQRELQSFLQNSLDLQSIA